VWALPCIWKCLVDKFEWCVPDDKYTHRHDLLLSFLRVKDLLLHWEVRTSFILLVALGEIVTHSQISVTVVDEYKQMT
jgi:hypothetical protein